ncbi:MAG: putative N-acetyltransferase [Rickettsiaceae bacterium]|jgi:RimJ/RimL family protein N-acetyltransferase|nr:putative N-acetyltransferase [Rickettsiaceae bacterium]
MVEINTPRLKIVTAHLGAAGDIANLMTEKIFQFTSSIPWPYTVEDARFWIANPSPEERLLVYLKPDTLIGAVGIPGKEGGELGFWINEKFEGKGYATEAITAAIDYFFKDEGSQFIDSSVHPDHAASCKMHEKLGFKNIGIEDRYWSSKKATIAIVAYRLTREDWESRN